MYKKELSFNDKLEIFDISNIKDGFIFGLNRKVVIFEYFSLFRESIMFDIIKEKEFDFQLKIKKEKFTDIKSYILNQKYMDFGLINSKKEEKYSIIINDDYRDQIGEKNIVPENLVPYLKEEKGEVYIYRHYLIINVKDNEINQLENIIYNFLYEISHLNLIIRRLNNSELEEYIFNEINYPININNKSNIKSYVEKEYSINNDLRFDLFDPSFLVAKVIKLFNKFITLIDHSFFQKGAENIGGFILDLINQRMFKGDNFFQIGYNYKGGLTIKGIPTEDFNILYNIFYHLEKGDSIILNLFSEKKHKLDKEIEIRGIDRVMMENNKEIESENLTYMQLIINFNDINPIILDKRIKKFQLDIGTDFYTQRIVNSMSKYISTAIGTGKNTMNGERGYNTKRLKRNLIF